MLVSEDGSSIINRLNPPVKRLFRLLAIDNRLRMVSIDCFLCRVARDRPERMELLCDDLILPGRERDIRGAGRSYSGKHGGSLDFRSRASV